jgi:membrane protein
MRDEVRIRPSAEGGIRALPIWHRFRNPVTEIRRCWKSSGDAVLERGACALRVNTRKERFMTEIGESESRATAPEPDDPRKPASPKNVRLSSWRYVARRTLQQFVVDQCIDRAAALTYFGILAVFPALLAIFSLLGVVGQGDRASTEVLRVVKQLAPGSTADLLQAPIRQFASASNAGLGVVIGIVLAVWTASGYVGAFTRAMNRIYAIDEGRPFWTRKPMQLLLTLAIIVLVALIAVVLIVSGPVTHAIGAALGLGPVATGVWSIVKWPILAAALVVAIALLYWATPNVRQPRFRWISIGSILALIVVLLATTGFAFYVANFSHYNRSYGSLAGVIIFMIWLWIANLALLLGAEFDAELERARELQAGIRAEEEIQLPPRATRQSERTRQKEDEFIDEAESMRRAGKTQ